MKRFLRENSLTLFFLAIFVAALVGQSIAGWHAYNDDQHDHGETAISFWGYVTSSSFGRAVLENWQSEYLQFTLYIMATVWFIQKGSSESKKLDRAGGDEGPGSDPSHRSPGSVDTHLLKLAAHPHDRHLAGLVGRPGVHGLERLQQRADRPPPATHDLVGYLGTAQFWEATLQNWQSEFLAVGSFAAFAIYLRQRGSPESKDVGAPDEQTG